MRTVFFFRPPLQFSKSGAEMSKNFFYITESITKNGTFWGHPRDVGHIYFLNSAQKHIKLTLTAYSILYSELR